MGPYLIFDKSFLESLTIAESVWLEAFFMPNITPIFFVETLADLEKKTKRGKSVRTPEDIVKETARKTPVMGSVAAMHHQRLVVGNLLGQEVEMTMHHRPIIGGGEYKQSADGKVSVDFERFPEFSAFARWQEQDFWEIERKIAVNWRQALSKPDFEQMISLVKAEIPDNIDFHNLADVKKLVDEFVHSRYNQFIYFAFSLLDIPERYRGDIKRRWSDTRPLPFNEFAPYAAHVLSVNLFFYLCLDKSFISKERPSNLVDVSYLYYLPFCSVFVSGDNLHQRITPLFIGEGQTFVSGNELKQDLVKLNAYYATLPDKVKALGVMKFAEYPPYDQDTLVGKLHDRHMSSSWRKNAKAHIERLFEPIPQDKKLLEKMNEKKKPYHGPPVSDDQIEAMTIARMVPVSRGGWRILPEGIENKKPQSS